MRCVFLVSLLLATVSIAGQQALEISQGKLATIGELLRQHNVELTEAALIDALKSSDADVRYLAAVQLAEDKASDAIPSIRQALEIEKAPRDRVNIAFALGLLGDENGGTELKKVCRDRSFVPEFRLYAVRYTLEFHPHDDRDCLRAAEDIGASKAGTVGDRVTALSLLTQFGSLTPAELRKTSAVMQKSLGDPEPTVRMAASNGLASLGATSAAPLLARAIAKEKDESVRAVFAEDLGKLQKSGAH
jgi:HEAT repeat protein